MSAVIGECRSDRCQAAEELHVSCLVTNECQVFEECQLTVECQVTEESGDCRVLGDCRVSGDCEECQVTVKSIR